MGEKYIKFNTTALFVPVDGDMYFELRPAFALNCYKDFILRNVPQVITASITV